MRWRTCGATAMALSTGALAQPAEAPFFENKTIDLVIGGDAGGGYDLYARLVAKYLPQYVPGKPTIVTRNMPGIVSANAASALAHTLPQDGTALGALFPGAVIGPLLDERAQKLYDPARVRYLASARLKGGKLRDGSALR